jgi:hypothetical protein
MTAALDRRASAGLDSVVVFTARAEARALLYAVGEIGLHQAVDELQDSAIESGFVAEIGQDAVQAILAGAFREVRG